jgi:hypothetical protein
MGTKSSILAATFFLLFNAFGQDRDTVIYDPNSGNYVIRYTATLAYARAKDGSLRRLGREDELREGDVYIELDSLFTTTFEPATKIAPTVTSDVTIEKGSKTFMYDYVLSNGAVSKQNLDYFIVEFGEDLEVFSRTNNGWRNQRRLKAGAEGLDNKWSWSGAKPGVRVIRPGESCGGFKLASPGLPGIANACFQGATSMRAQFAGAMRNRELAKQIFALRTFPTNYVSKKTIAPIVKPDSIAVSALLDSLISYTRQSAALGWLGRSRDNDCDDDERPDDGITKNIEKRLEKAKKELSKGDSTKARKELEKLVDKVERIWKRSQDEEKKHKGEQRERKEDVIMTSEAYALLLYNTEYLIDRLPDGKEKKGEKEKKGGDKDDD